MKTILLPYHEQEAARSALGTALLVARRFESHICGLLVLGEPLLDLSVLAVGVTIPPEYLEEATAEWRRFADRARGDFLQAARAAGLGYAEIEAATAAPSVGWREAQGLEGDVVGEQGRAFDLIVVGRNQDAPGNRWNALCEAALFESGRPVLLAPREVPESLGRSIVIAWNGSVESARTVAMGMPMLHAAESVLIVSVKENMVSGPTAAQMVVALQRHGIAATERRLDARGRPPGEVILEEAGDFGADLIFKGAFTRSRVRQIIFGGTTRHIMDYARLPVLMAH